MSVLVSAGVKVTLDIGESPLYEFENSTIVCQSNVSEIGLHLDLAFYPENVSIITSTQPYWAYVTRYHKRSGSTRWTPVTPPHFIERAGITFHPGIPKKEIIVTLSTTKAYNNSKVICGAWTVSESRVCDGGRNPDRQRRLRAASCIENRRHRF